MALEIQAVVHATQAWLQTSRHIQVPFAWLEACVTWLQEEAGGAGRLSQQQVNQQVLDQWLLTDLRDLDHPVLPEGLAQAQKTQLSGTFCVQVDSLLDVSQPAYGQLQKLKGTDCANDEVSAVTQFTQKPWEARPTRMLMLQVTDGVQSLEAMEYQPIPALSAALRPGVKLQLNGRMVCRLGVLLLGPSNIKILGGEVEDLVDRNNQGRMLCRTLGLPEEEERQQGQREQEEEGLLPPQQGNQEVEDIELDDAELLASLEAQEEVDMAHAVSTASFTSEAAGLAHRGDGGRSARVHHRHDNQQRDSDLLDRSPSDYRVQQEISDHHMEDFPDEDFDDLPLDELDAAISQEGTGVSGSGHRGAPQNGNAITANPNRAARAQFEQRASDSSGLQLGFNNRRSTTEIRDYRSTRGFSAHVPAATSSSLSSPPAFNPTPELDFVTNNESEFMDEDLDSFLHEVQTEGTGLPAQQGSTSSHRLTSDPSRSAAPLSVQTNPAGHSSAPALTLTSAPFTYLRLLEETRSKRRHQATEVRVKAFIVTLLGKLSSNNGVWCICATISDGTGYLDVELSDEVLTGLLGFSVAEKGALKRDPARRSHLDAGMKRCQEELVDMCCIMTVTVEPEGRKAVVTKAEPVTEKVVQELEQRVRDGRK